MTFITGEFVDDSRVLDDSAPAPFEGGSFYCGGQKVDWDQVAVYGLVRSVTDPTSGEQTTEFVAAMVKSVEELDPDEIEDAVFASHFVGPDGHLELPETAEEILVHLVDDDQLAA